LVGDDVVCDTTRILSKIEQLFPGVFTRQLDARGAAEAWLWEEFADAGLSGFVIAAAWCDDRNWSAIRQAYFGNAPWFVRTIVAPMVRKANRQLLVERDVLRAGDEACWARFVETLDKLERRAPATTFWLGDAVSRADIALFAQLQSLRAPMFRWQRIELESRRALVAYLDRVDLATRGSPAVGSSSSKRPSSGDRGDSSDRASSTPSSAT
jgi:glutathione S-transferase